MFKICSKDFIESLHSLGGKYEYRCFYLSLESVVIVWVSHGRLGTASWGRPVVSTRRRFGFNL